MLPRPPFVDELRENTSVYSVDIFSMEIIYHELSDDFVIDALVSHLF